MFGQFYAYISDNNPKIKCAVYLFTIFMFLSIFAS